MHFRSTERGEAQATPQRRLNKALYVYNFLNSSAEEPDPPIYRHFLNNKKAKLEEHPPVLIKNLESGKIERPYDLIIWGKGFACIFTCEGLKWIPAKNVKPHHTSKPADGSTSASDPVSESREAAPKCELGRTTERRSSARNSSRKEWSFIMICADACCFYPFVFVFAVKLYL